MCVCVCVGGEKHTNQHKGQSTLLCCTSDLLSVCVSLSLATVCAVSVFFSLALYRVAWIRLRLARSRRHRSRRAPLLDLRVKRSPVRCPLQHCTLNVCLWPALRSAALRLLCDVSCLTRGISLRARVCVADTSPAPHIAGNFARSVCLFALLTWDTAQLAQLAAACEEIQPTFVAQEQPPPKRN